MPIQMSRERLPPDVPRLGQGVQGPPTRVAALCTIRLQPDSLSYHRNFLDLDPRYRDKSGLGLPLVRITYDLRENESRLAQTWRERRKRSFTRWVRRKPGAVHASVACVAATTSAGAAWAKTPPPRW